MASAETTPFADPRGGPTELTDARLERFLEQMIEIRLFEDEIQTLFTRNLVRGSTHLCTGQEAVSVGTCAALRTTDAMLCTYRGHGAVLAKGAPLDRAFGEILGKAQGLCGGKGGSMHLTDVDVGAYGSFAIVGAHLPIATGFGFAARYSNSDDVCACFFGDGTINIGAFHESMNLAAIWKLPVVFVLENNLYGEYSPVARTTPIEILVERASGYAMPGARVDGNDVAAVYETVAHAVERARAGEGPTLIEALTYRHKGHSRTDPGTYRPAEEVEHWLARDPIQALEKVLRERGAADERIAEIRTAATSNVDEHLKRALGWPEPSVESRFEHVYA
ncbi:MAG TPA: thiamine pyrophosphate-dependent dehydrogenase E1 component subunit alpha [Thermoleophilaceae bacterium]|nr:thiamine pyrophosphate-dependent dehydrogenase E1 component subunit alpha [Thermoleophilaceae bacterium]